MKNKPCISDSWGIHKDRKDNSVSFPRGLLFFDLLYNILAMSLSS